MNSQNTSSLIKICGEFKAAFLKDLRSYVRYPAWLLGEFISTPLWFFFFALGVTLFSPTNFTNSSVNSFDFFYFGFIFIILFSTAVWGIGQSIRNEQQAGTLEQFFLAPVNRATLIVGRWALRFSYRRFDHWLHNCNRVYSWERTTCDAQPQFVSLLLGPVRNRPDRFRIIFRRLNDANQIVQYIIQHGIFRLHDSNRRPLSDRRYPDPVSLHFDGHPIHLFH